MEQPPNASFIPRQGAGTAAAPVSRRRGFNIIGFFSVILFLASILLAGGVFAYKQYSETELEKSKSELAKRRAQFQNGDIQSIQALELRLRAAKDLLESHVSPSKLLDLLEQVTQEKIQYVDFKFTRRPSGNVGVEMKGIAPAFNTVALQEKRLKDEPMFASVIFSNLNKTEEGNVMFQVNLEIRSAAIAYDAVGVYVPTDTTLGTTTGTGTTTKKKRDETN